MWNWTNETLKRFRSCFSRKIPYEWFIVIVLGLMLRSDHLGITSIVREFFMTDAAYHAMLNFFRSTAWNKESVMMVWLDILKSTSLLLKEADRYILIGDGVKEAKEGRKIPGVKKLHQESDNSSKGEYIFGQMFGGIGILIGNGTKTFCALLSAKLHEGIEPMKKWREGDNYIEESHVVKIIRDAAVFVARLGASILLLDRLYLTRPMLRALNLFPGLSVVTRAKFNCSAFFPPGPYKGRGARPKKGDKVKVASFFDTHFNFFKEVVLNLYGKDEIVRYFCIDLKWGEGLYQNLRFVLTEGSKGKAIWVSTDLTLSPTQIIRLYSRRFKIECSFRELKQVIAGFACHFWSKAMPKLQKYKSNDINCVNLEAVNDPRQRELITAATDAVERYVQLGIIALGMLQLIALHFGDEINKHGNRFMRTKSNATPSERTVADYMRKNIFRVMQFSTNLTIMQIISARQIRPIESDDEFNLKQPERIA